MRSKLAIRNRERLDRIRTVLRENRWDMMVCALPMNVLLLSGYWPVVGTGVAVACADGSVSLLVPEDEADLARRGWADEVRTFEPDPLEELTTASHAILSPFKALVKSISAAPVRAGMELRATSEPASYAGMYLYAEALKGLLGEIAPSLTIQPADDALSVLRARKTEFEITQIRTSCRIAEEAFGIGFGRITVGASEVEIAAGFREPLSASLVGSQALGRADGFTWCMSGGNSALASRAYAYSRYKRIEPDDLVLVHMNSYADGYWTDITRTYSYASLDDRRRRMYEAVFAARHAALGAVRPGVRAADIDTAAREVLAARGFGQQFKHATGHGVGFSAIAPNAIPRLHPKSGDVLETGMVFNVEPAIYIDGYGGVRHCDMIAVGESGAELLTPFQCGVDELVIAGRS